jgi:Flp pilus assembly protein TadD
VAKTNYQLGYDLIVSLYERLGLTQRATAIRAMAKASGAYRDPADPWLDSLIEDCFEPYRLALAAGAIGRNGDVATARRLLERAVDVAPDDVAIRFQLGTLLVGLGQLDAAETQLIRCTVLAPDFADGWAHLSSVQTQLGRGTEGDRTLAEGLKHCPDSAGLHLMLARKHQDAGRLGEAIAEFQESIRLRPNEADAYIELGRLYIRAGREAEAIHEMRRALAAEPGNPQAIGILAYNAVANGTETEARNWIAQVRNQPRVESDQVGRLVTAFQQRFGRAP